MSINETYATHNKLMKNRHCYNFQANRYKPEVCFYPEIISFGIFRKTVCKMMKLVCLLLSCFTTVTHAEPECSRYHYEEKTLEKMVRLEFVVEQFKVEMDNFRKEKEDTITEIKKDVANEMNNARKSVEADKATKLARALSEFQAMKHNMTDEISKAIQQLQDAKKRVFFSAKTTLTDTDDAYNNKTGIFMAPVSGTYVFNTQICSTTNIIYFAININKVAIARSSTYNVYNCNMVEAFAEVQVGSEVYVTVEIGHSKILQDDNTRWNTFHGRLLYSRKRDNNLYRAIMHSHQRGKLSRDEKMD
ncbi:hypothetical protein MAR_028020 [Mya arenaria]|uniref:C1q domain-containing protein n=1 Tax=Mya arenaria TaxID=6604 RepID=A0ABY7DK01_MYAAR|nr:hypothetical protein MAR_028020 [Mya arenaria]